MTDLAAIFTAAAVLITAVTGLLTVVLIDLRKVRAQVAGVVTQVKNTHPTNLRDDIDDLGAAQKTMLATLERVENAQTTLAGEVRQERARIIRLDNDAHDTHRDLYGHIRRIDNILQRRRPKQ